MISILLPTTEKESWPNGRNATIPSQIRSSIVLRENNGLIIVYGQAVSFLAGCHL
jgi:hypothetical protein